MKTIIRILIFTLTLSLCGCKTKEKVTEKLTETAQSNSSFTLMTSQYIAQQEQKSMMEETILASWCDSIVERFYERIVTDSTGRVLLHEQEHKKDHYNSRARSQTNRNGNSEEAAAGQKIDLTAECNDSTYNGGILSEVTVVKKKSWRWLWFVGILGSLLIVGIIIPKVTRR